MELIVFAIVGLTLGALDFWASSHPATPETPVPAGTKRPGRIAVRTDRTAERSARLLDLMTAREERAHCGRIERLSSQRASAEAAGDDSSTRKIDRLLSLEEARHREKLRRLAR